MKPYFEKTAILGVGLIGASLSMAIKKQGLSGHVAGYGRTEANLKKAEELSIIDSYELDPLMACEGADLIVFATPVGLFSDIAGKIKHSVKKDALVIDVGSVKGGLVYEMERIFGGRFVGCHPIAGGERSGIEYASAELFRGAKCIITKTENTPSSAINRATGIWEALGSSVDFMSPEEHDRVYALVSHLPHIIAYAIMNTVADGEYLKFSGRGFRDMTRIASSSPELWRDICLLNRDNLLLFMEKFSQNMEKLRLYLKNGDVKALDEAFGRAGALRRGLEG